MHDDALRNRLLRRLRTCCTTLSRHHAPITRKAPVITYSSAQSSSNAAGPSDFPPLSVLQPPDNWHSVAFIDLSRKIYAVRDAFKEIVSRSCGVAHSESEAARVPRLADLCASMVGRSMEAKEVTSEEDNDEDNEEESDEESVDENIVEQLYDAVPEEYRK